MEKEIQNLKKQVLELEKTVKALMQYSTIPLPIEQAFAGRGFVNALKPDIPDNNGDYTTNIGFRQTISLSGVAQDITVPAFPVRFMRLKDGSNLFIPLHTYAEFGI